MEINESRGEKIKELISLAEKQLEIQSKGFGIADQKAMIFVPVLITMISFIAKDFLKFMDSGLMASLFFAFASLGFFIWEIFPRTFHIGVDSTKMTTSFWGKDHTVDDLQKDSLSNLNFSTNENSKVLKNKIKILKFAFGSFALFLISFFFFFVFNYDRIFQS